MQVFTLCSNPMESCPSDMIIAIGKSFINECVLKYLPVKCYSLEAFPLSKDWKGFKLSWDDLWLTGQDNIWQAESQKCSNYKRKTAFHSWVNIDSLPLPILYSIIMWLKTSGVIFITCFFNFLFPQSSWLLYINCFSHFSLAKCSDVVPGEQKDPFSHLSTISWAPIAWPGTVFDTGIKKMITLPLK